MRGGGGRARRSRVRYAAAMRRLFFIAAALVALAAAPASAAPVRVLLRTEAGPITLELFPERAPITVANFLAYVDQGLWKGASFYRSVSPANDHNPATIAVLQGGLDRDDGPLPPIPHESTRTTGLSHHRGMVSMARGAPGTASDEFFIVTAESPALDFGGARNPDGQGFAVFGRVAAGMDVVDRIHDAPLARGGADAYTAGQQLAKPVRILAVVRTGAPH